MYPFSDAGRDREREKRLREDFLEKSVFPEASRQVSDLFPASMESGWPPVTIS